MCAMDGVCYAPACIALKVSVCVIELMLDDLFSCVDI